MSSRSPLRRLPGSLPRWRLALSLFFCLALAFAPSLAEARAGSSHFGGASSFGSRGSRTFENNGATPLSRSMTATPPAASPYAGAYGGGYFQRHPFISGLFGGFLGSMLFRSLGGFGHVLGGFLTLLILGFLVFLIIRLLTGRGSPGSGMPRSIGAAAAPVLQFRGRDTAVSDADLTAFQHIHAAVQEAWGRGDLGHLRALMTPEMLSYFSEELTRNASQGVQNLVSNVTLLKGEVSESWEEDGLQYATAYMRWSGIDQVVQLGRAPGEPDRVISGDPRVPVEAEEVWTFVRGRGGNWLLSAIQQV